MTVRKKLDEKDAADEPLDMFLEKYGTAGLTSAEAAGGAGTITPTTAKSDK